MRIDRWIVAFFVSITLCGSAHGWEKTVSVNYSLGDSDSRITARESAYEALKVEAASSAKTYIQTTKELSGGDLSETVKMVGASMVSLSDTSETYKGGEGRNGVFYVTATASIDENKLEQRIKQLQMDREKERSLQALTKKNQSLRAELASLRDQLNNRSNTTKDLPDLLERQNEKREQLNEIESKVNEVFEQGTLIEMASQANSELADIKDDIKARFIQAIIDADFEPNIVKVRPTDSGYEALVDLDFDLDIQRFTDVLANYLDVSSLSRGLEVSGYANQKGKGPLPASDSVYRWLAQQEVVAKVTLGGKTEVVPLVYVAEDFMRNCGSVGVDNVGSGVDDLFRGSICVQNKPDAGDRMFGVNDNEPFPISITLGEEQARAATAVDVELEWRRPTHRAQGY